MSFAFICILVLSLSPNAASENEYERALAPFKKTRQSLTKKEGLTCPHITGTFLKRKKGEKK